MTSCDPNMSYRRLHFLPITVFILVLATFVITYCMAVALEHVDPGFPYISETGSISPESCVFAQLINFAVAVMLFCVYLRYRQVQELSRLGRTGSSVTPRANLVALWLGIGSCLGLDIVANFQQSNVLVVHLLGAALCFGCGTIFFCMQTWFSRYMLSTKYIFEARAILSVLSVLLTITTIAPAGIALSQFSGKDKMKWRPEDGGWEWHLVSTVSEWLLVVCFCGFILSFSNEFSCVTLDAPIIRILDVDPSQNNGTSSGPSKQIEQQ